MAITSLKDLYIDQLQDLYSANVQAKRLTAAMVEHATDSALKDSLTTGIDAIDRNNDALDAIIRSHGANPNGEYCKGMEGLVKEARAHVIEAGITDPDVRDAAIIPQHQRIAHYAIAGYGTVRTFARRLGLSEDAMTLGAMLDNAYEGDRAFTEIANAGVNEGAMA